ncbi:MAG: hypothetical protein CMM91_10315 [Rickettsiales bacterium]|nr:hypothetical protein [Rickettsiales bacterium]OUV52868.1 MAG: hypothetical protein CBC87_05800 [Rickettsiales bacterium TMED127]|tara:strand:- start:687 stop:1415 length:729 start_codon:yes stop_codon:yes gene_type:complete
MWNTKLYIKNNLDFFEIKKSKLELFKECKKCFYLHLVKGIKRPYGPPLAINNILGKLIKEEINSYREKEICHPLMKDIDCNIIPAKHKFLKDWQNSFSGLYFKHNETKLMVRTTISDLWYNVKTKEYVPVDYKFTAKNQELSLHNIYPGYWRQLSLIKLLLEKIGIKISREGYIVYSNVDHSKKVFNSSLNFKSSVFSNTLQSIDLESNLQQIFNILQNDKIPSHSKSCKYCSFVQYSNEVK